MKERTGEIHTALTDMMDGHQTSVGAINGWFVKSGMLHTPPILCPKHQAVIHAVNARSLEIRKQLKLQESEKTKATGETNGRFHRSGSNLDDDHERLDKLEVIRMKK